MQTQDKASEAMMGFKQNQAREQLVAWVMEHVIEWEKWRQQNFDVRWKDYWRKWRGIWDVTDKTRSSERSQLISPVLQQAVEEAVAEIEEAALGDKEGWFDIEDDEASKLAQTPEEAKENWDALRNQIDDDMDYANVSGAMVECIFSEALYGTTIGKLVTQITTDRKLKSQLDVSNKNLLEGIEEHDKILVTLEPVRPDQFVIDTAVNKPGREGISQALGMAHRLYRPRHILRQKMEDYEKNENGEITLDSTYWEVPLDGGSSFNSLQTTFNVSPITPWTTNPADAEDSNLVTEYHGLVPTKLLKAAIKDEAELVDVDSRDMTESVITIIDDIYCAKARENTNLKKDRDFIAAPWDQIPGSFWGRGVSEKGYNSQKALDAMLRAKLDGLAYTVHPMMGVNAQRRDPRHKIEVGSGKIIYVNGSPQEALFPLRFGNIDQNAFTVSGELERLIQIATGTAGGAASMSSNAGQSTLGGMSVVASRLAKRHKRTLRLLERHFLMPLIEKFTLRHMQYNEQVYPFIDLRFRVRTAMSLVAREVENTTLSTLLQTIPTQSPVFYALLGQIVQNTSIKDKGVVLQLIQQVIQGQAPGSPEDKKGLENQQLKQAREVANLSEVQSRTRLKDITALEKATKIGLPAKSVKSVKSVQ